MKHLCLLILLCALISGAAADSPNHPAPTEKKFSLELFGGLGFVQPDHLNAWVNSSAVYLNFITEQQYQGLQQLPGARVRIRGGINGDFETIKAVLHSGFRLRFALNPSLALSAGARWMTQKEQSRVIADYEISGVTPGGMNFQQDFIKSFEYPSTRIFAQGFAPMLGVHYRPLRSQRLIFELFASAGAFWASCDMDFLEISRTSFRDAGDHYWDERDAYNRVQGDGVGLALESGARVEFRPASWLGIFVESAYGYFKVKNLSGRETYRYRRMDKNGAQDVQEFIFDGELGLREQRGVYAWGSYSVRFPSVIGRSSAPYSDFILDLSGIRLSAGLSLLF